MALATLLDEIPLSASTTLLLGLTVVLALSVARRAFFHPLSHVPGPLICKVTSLWMYYHSYIGDECTCIDKLHRKYGPVIRIAPNEVCISDGAALAPVYSEKGGFLKARCYENFDIDGHASIFSALDPAHRAVRSKAVLAMFSTSNIRAGNEVIQGCVDRLVKRMQEDAAESRKSKTPVNVLNLARSLAVDAVSAYLFQQNYAAVNETGHTMSASEFVNAFVAVGRFFYLPNWWFTALEMASAKFWPNKEVDESMAKVDEFVNSVVESSDKGQDTYQGRMLRAGITPHETAAQCKDLIFAGTDSTGMNLSTIFWSLAKYPTM